MRVARKAISPIIAVVLLIGVVLVIGGVVASFVTQIVNNQQDQAIVAQRCLGENGAKVILQNAIYNPTSDNLTLIVYNYGNVNLAFIPTVEYYDTSKHAGSQLLEAFSSFAVNAGSIQTITLHGVEDDITKVTIQSATCDPPCYRCPGAQDTLLSTNIRGL